MTKTVPTAARWEVLGVRLFGPEALEDHLVPRLAARAALGAVRLRRYVTLRHDERRLWNADGDRRHEHVLKIADNILAIVELFFIEKNACPFNITYTIHFV